MSEAVTNTEAVVARIRAYAEYMGWSKSRLAAEAGLRDTTLRHIDKARWNPTLETLRRLEALIPTTFMTSAGVSIEKAEKLMADHASAPGQDRAEPAVTFPVAGGPT